MRKVYLIPNFVTTANMFCGFYSAIASIHQDFGAAAWAIVAAGVFDMLDGRIARLAKATSQFGVEYDSLSDLISFGLAPSLLLYQWALEPYGRLGWCAAFLFMACCALRLARFNVNSNILPKGYFQGLPTPMAAGMIATFIIFNQTIAWPSFRPTFVLFLTFGLATLMVSNLKFPSFKEFNWRSRESFGFLMVGILTMILVAIKPEVTLFLTLAGYVSLSVVWNFVTFVGGHAAASKAETKGSLK